jgi:hypothetical protein
MVAWDTGNPFARLARDAISSRFARPLWCYGTRVRATFFFLGGLVYFVPIPDFSSRIPPHIHIRTLDVEGLKLSILPLCYGTGGKRRQWVP